MCSVEGEEDWLCIGHDKDGISNYRPREGWIIVDPQAEGLSCAAATRGATNEDHRESGCKDTDREQQLRAEQREHFNFIPIGDPLSHHVCPNVKVKTQKISNPLGYIYSAENSGPKGVLVTIDFSGSSNCRLVEGTCDKSSYKAFKFLSKNAKADVARIVRANELERLVVRTSITSTVEGAALDSNPNIRSDDSSQSRAEALHSSPPHRESSGRIRKQSYNTVYRKIAGKWTCG